MCKLAPEKLAKLVIFTIKTPDGHEVSMPTNIVPELSLCILQQSHTPCSHSQKIFYAESSYFVPPNIHFVPKNSHFVPSVK